MKIEKASEIKSREGEEFLHTDPDEIDEADRLSIEALKRIASGRNPDRRYVCYLLPGETKD